VKNLTELSKKLSEARKKAGLTLRELSELSGLSKATIINYEKGKRIPRVNDLQKIADSLSCEISVLLSNPPQPPVSSPEDQGAEKKTA
jgi:transcriptional regulator with XRE-family HTH domain